MSTFQELPNLTPIESQVAIQVGMLSNVPVNLIGEAGAGKSKSVENLARMGNAALKDKGGFGYIDFRLSDKDGVLDVRGITFKHILDSGRIVTASAPPHILLPALEPGWRGIIFGDEWPLGDDEARKAWMRALTDYYIGEHQLSEGAVLVMAGNRAKDRPIGSRISGPEANRVMHCVVKQTVKEWTTHAPQGFEGYEDELPDVWNHTPIALPHHVDKRICGFLNWRSDYFQDYDPDLFAAGKTAYGTARTWEYASRVLSVVEDTPEFKKWKGIKAVKKAMCSGLVGTTAATECLATMDLLDRIIKVKDVIANPDTARLPDPNDEKCVGICWMGMGTLTSEKHFNKDTADPIVKYTRRLAGHINGDLGKVCIAMLEKSNSEVIREALHSSKEYHAYKADLSA